MSETPTTNVASTSIALRERVEQLLARRDTLAPALEAFAAELPAGPYGRELRSFLTKLERGDTAEKLCQSPRTVATMLPLLAGGAQSAEAGERLNQLFAESVREEQLRRQRRRVLAYPIVVALLAGAVLVFLCITVVPVYSTTFDEFNFELPTLTVWVARLSRSIRQNPFELSLTLTAVIASVYLLWRAITMLGWSEKLFGFTARGSSRELSAMASFTRRLADGLAAKLPLSAALEVAGATSERRSIRVAAEDVSSAIVVADDANGDRHDAFDMPAARRFPATVVHVLRTSAADCGATVHLLDEFADALVERIRNRFDWATGIMAQLAILLVGLIVAAVLIAMVWPLVRLVDGLTG